MKRFYNYVSVTLVFVLLMTAPVLANNLYEVGATLEKDSTGIQNIIDEFVEYIAANDEEYSMWQEATVEFGYALLDYDRNQIVAKLFYLRNGSQKVGYIIVDEENQKVVEFSLAPPAYDLAQIDGNKQYIYTNGLPLIYVDELYYQLTFDGKVISNDFDIQARAFYPNLQGGENCIVCAISNLMWHYGQNGYPVLIANMNFADVMSSVKSIIVSEGGYANNNIPNTISRYIGSKTSDYSVLVTNQWNPSFYDVQIEVNNRPCLLGFAAGASSYSEIEGHMTMCVGTYLINDWGYVKVIDGHSSYVVNKAWGSYNDFIAKVTFPY